MDIQTAADQAGRLIGHVYRQARDSRVGSSDMEEPTAGAIWEKAAPDLDKALAVFDQKESPSTPDSAWNPFADTKQSCQKDLETILDALLVVLGTCGAVGYRSRIRICHDDIRALQVQIGESRERMLSAPLEASQNFLEGLVIASRESLKEQIAYGNDQIAEKTRQIESLKVGFREHLQQIDINVSPETVDSLLLPVEDEFVSMAAVITNIGRLTKQLQHLVDDNGEAASHTKRYYGIYVLLVLSIDRLQKHFVRRIDEKFLPKLAGFEQEAVRNVADAQALIRQGEHRDQLSANVVAGSKTIHACQLMVEMLRSQKRSVLEENKKVQILAAAAVNTYRTVCLSFDVADLIGHCEAAFRALRELRIPPLRPFRNVQLNEELQRLADRMVEKG